MSFVLSMYSNSPYKSSNNSLLSADLFDFFVEGYMFYNLLNDFSSYNPLSFNNSDNLSS